MYQPILRAKHPTPYLPYKQYFHPPEKNPATYLSNSTASSAPTENFAVYVPVVFDGIARFFDLLEMWNGQVVKGLGIRN